LCGTDAGRWTSYGFTADRQLFEAQELADHLFNMPATAKHNGTPDTHRQRLKQEESRSRQPIGLSLQEILETIFGLRLTNYQV
jgi:hypothetical protein